MKLELGAGPDRQTPGYLHNDVNPFAGIDYVGNAWELDLPDGSLSEVIAVSFMEHLTYAHVRDTLANVYRMLEPRGVFLFDVPNLAAWCRYFLEGHPDFDQAYCLRTLYGWQRWPGDEHISGWTPDLLEEYVMAAKFSQWTVGPEPLDFVERDIYRYRFTRWKDDAHWFVQAVK